MHSILQPGALSHVGDRAYLSPRVLPFSFVAHFYMGYYSFYRPQKDERLSRPSWLAYSGQYIHISGHPSPVSRVQDRESLLAKTDILPTVPCSQSRHINKYLKK